MPAMRRDDLWSIGLLPVLAAGALAGFLGLYWDISWHIDKGRDTFFTPPHDFIYGALLAVLIVADYGLRRDRRDTPYHIRAGRYRLHPGVLIVTAGAALVLLFAPLDDLWHRLYGVDVTLWGPMHLVGLLGLAVGRFGGLVCAWIERRLTDDPRRRRLFGDLAVFFAATLLAGVVVVTGEYEFVVPQFPMFFHPVLLAGLPVFPLLLIALLVPRPYAATVTAILFTAMRIALAGWLMIAAHLDWGGISQPSIPLLIPTAIAVDLLVERRAPGWLAGVGAGAVTFAANLVMIDGIAPAAGGIRLFWTAGVSVRALAPALALSALMGAAAAAAAASLGAAPRSGVAPETRTEAGQRSRARLNRIVIVLAAAAALAAGSAASVVAAPALRVAPRTTAQIAIADGGSGRPSLVTVRVAPPDAPRGGEMLLSMFRPGGMINRQVLEPAAPGVYRGWYVFPVAGTWWYYARFGPGQWGSVAGGPMDVGGTPGTVDRAALTFRGKRRRAPEYVQPLGYAAFGLLGALALAGITAVLAGLRRVSA